MKMVVNEPTLMHNGHTRSCSCGCQERRQAANAAVEDVPDWTELTANEAAEMDALTVAQMTAGEDWQAVLNEEKRRRGQPVDEPSGPVENAHADDDWIAGMMRSGSW